MLSIGFKYVLILKKNHTTILKSGIEAKQTEPDLEPELNYYGLI